MVVAFVVVIAADTATVTLTPLETRPWRRPKLHGRPAVWAAGLSFWEQGQTSLAWGCCRTEATATGLKQLQQDWYIEKAWVSWKIGIKSSGTDLVRFSKWDQTF